MFGWIGDLLGFDTPDPPDYRGAAEEQAQSSREVTEQQTWANRPNQYTPWGSSVWNSQQYWDPVTNQNLNRWTNTTTLNPALQGALTDQFATTAARSKLGKNLTTRLNTEMGSPMDWTGFNPMGARVTPQNYGNINKFRKRQEDAVYDRMTDRLDDQWGRRRESLTQDLYNKGFMEGDEGFTNQMELMSQQENDAYQNAMNEAIMMGGEEAQRQIGMGGQILNQQQQGSAYDTMLRQQGIAEEMQRRGFSLNEINAALYGQQVGMPQMPSFATASRSDPTNYQWAAEQGYGAGWDKYNARQGAFQNIFSGLGTLGEPGGNFFSGFGGRGG